MKVIFTVSLSEYDENLYEDDETNRLKDSLECFKQCINLDVFQKKNIFLVFTKKDLFEKKIKKIELKYTFPEFKDENTSENAFNFIKQQFLNQEKNDSNRIKVFSVCTLDQKEVSDILKLIINSIDRIN